MIKLYTVYKSKNNNYIYINKYNKNNEYPYEGQGLLWEHLYNNFDENGKIFSRGERGESMFDLVQEIGTKKDFLEYFL